MCLSHSEPLSLSIMKNHNKKSSFSTEWWVTQRDLNTSHDLNQLKKWIAEKKVIIRDIIPEEKERLKMMQLIWTYCDLKFSSIRDLSATDLIVHCTWLKAETSIYNVKQQRFFREKKWWFHKFVLKEIEFSMYEWTVIVNRHLSQWGAASVLIKKKEKTELRLTFNYHYVFEELSENHMKLITQTHEFLTHLTHESFFFFDLKNIYWGVIIHSDDRHLLTFNISEISQLQST